MALNYLKSKFGDKKKDEGPVPKGVDMKFTSFGRQQAPSYANPALSQLQNQLYPGRF